MQEKTDLEKIMEVLASFDMENKEESAKTNETNNLSQANDIKGILKKVEKQNIEKFIKYLESSRTLSTSAIQRYLCIGFSSACKIIDYLEDIGLLTKPDEKTKQRTIISVEDIIETLTNDD